MALMMLVEPATVTRILAVEEASQVGEVRRAALALADRAGMDETGRGRAGIVATELATNLARHARGGAVLLRLLPDDERGVELIAVDHGPGMDVDRCLADGYSTGGTAGEGLGAVRRLSGVFDAYSRSGEGSVVLARLLAAAPAPHERASPLAVGVVCSPAPGEEHSGDGWAVDRQPGRVRILVVDGLGHGPIAATAATEAIRLFRAYPQSGPAEMLERLHDGLRATRGAAAAVAELVPDAAAVRYAGIGNISATVAARDGRRSLMSHNGIVGHQVRKVQELTYPWSPDASLVMTSDGVRTQWRLEDHPGVTARHPAILAALLHRDHLRGRDDATVLVARAAAPTPP